MKKILFILIASLLCCGAIDAKPSKKCAKKATTTKLTEKCDHEWVDLGLPSGTLWATTNVGASKPEEYGSYFAWGETKPKKSYSLNNYKWCRGSLNRLTKYCTDSSYGTVDGKKELELEDDAAYVNWGPEWRMPSKEQQDELRAECTWTWTERNGVYGYEVSRNGKSIFLPANGERYKKKHNRVGTYGGYWSTTLDADGPSNSFDLTFNPDNVDWVAGGRDYGQCVRAVRMSKE